MTKPRIVSIDVGNGFTKAMSSTQTVCFPSVIAEEQGAIDFEGFNTNQDFVIEYEGTRYALGETAWRLGRMRVSDMDRSRVGSLFYKTLFAGALAAVVQQPAILSVVLSLPVQWYSDRESVKEKMSGEYLVGFCGRKLSYHVSHDFIRIVPEGFGTVASIVLDKNGKIENRSLADSRIGVVDIGTKTTDFLFFNALELYPSKCGGIPTALSDVWRTVAEGISKRIGRNLELYEIDDAMHTGYFKHRGVRVDIEQWRDPALRALSDSIAGEIKTRWSGGDEVDMILVTGGGAKFVYSFFDFPHKACIEDGHMANCEGAFRYGLLRSDEV